MKPYKLFTKEECNEILYILSKYNLVQVASNGDSYKIQKIEKTYWFYERMVEWVKKELNLDLKEPGVVVLKYEEGDSMALHIDKGEGKKHHQDFVWNVNLILNDEYEGGCFVLDGKEYKEPAGSIYYYPSDKLHGVTEITSGERYILVMYVRQRDIKLNKNLI